MSRCLPIDNADTEFLGLCRIKEHALHCIVPPRARADQTMSLTILGCYCIIGSVVMGTRMVRFVGSCCRKMQPTGISADVSGAHIKYYHRSWNGPTFAGFGSSRANRGGIHR